MHTVQIVVCSILLISYAYSWYTVPWKTLDDDEEKPGRCPEIILTRAGDSVDKCKWDSDCPGDRKCCNTQIGWLCLKPEEKNPPSNGYPVSTKAGSCPSISYGKRFDGRKRNMCDSDDDCPGHKKCCATVDGLACLLPEKPTPADGKCADNSEPLSYCSHHHPCPYGYFCDGDVCCRIIKAGRCPPNERDAAGVRVHLVGLGKACDCDCDCIGNYKCCIQNGKGVCAKPTRGSPKQPHYNNYYGNLYPYRQDKPGFCPPFYGQPSLTSLDRCRGDVQCPGDRKCCQTLNGRVCLKPQTTAVHLCPDNSVPLKECVRNQCPVNYQCIKGSCCRSNIKQEKVGTCPPNPSGKVNTAGNQCEEDNDCELTRKCCPTFSGTRCLLPLTSYGICPDKQRSYQTCKNSDSCAAGFFCSRGFCCKDAGSADNQLPTCPTYKPNNFESGRFCLSDNDCKRSQKCCKYESQSRCTSASDNFPGSSISKAGKCPNFSGEMIDGAVDTCMNDSACNGERKCCKTIASMSSTNTADEDSAKHMALMFFLDHLMQKNGRRSIHDLSCQFGARGFTADMRQAVGGSKESLADFLAQFPSLFSIDDGQVTLKGYGDDPANALASQPACLNKERDSVAEAIRFFTEKLRKFGPELPVKSLLGHRSQASPDVRLVSGCHFRDFSLFLSQHKEAFVVTGDRVCLKEAWDEMEKGVDQSETEQLNEPQVVDMVVQFLVSEVEAHETAVPLEVLYRKFCNHFPLAVRKRVNAANPKELMQFLKLSRHLFFIRSNKVSMNRRRTTQAGGVDYSSGLDDDQETDVSSNSSTSKPTNAPTRSTAQKDITIARSLQSAVQAVHDIVCACEDIASCSSPDLCKVLAVHFKSVIVGQHEFLTLITICTPNGRIFVFDVEYTASILLECGLKDILESDEYLKIVHGSKRAARLLWQHYKIRLWEVFDTQIAQLLIENDESGVSLFLLRRGSVAALVHYLNAKPLFDHEPLRAQIREQTSAAKVDEVCHIVEELFDLFPNAYRSLRSRLPSNKLNLFTSLCQDAVSNLDMPPHGLSDQLSPQPQMENGHHGTTTLLQESQEPSGSHSPVMQQLEENNTISTKNMNTTSGHLVCTCKAIKRISVACQTASTGDITSTTFFTEEP
ncbi:Antileukoproteinase [Trichinella murrelli]|uniref:Antileukoproteinase n=1 Tax=Trichinella murrelli TaxID=144512 RepID=A0A0V0U5Q9_9BILA|nr:Antileukoproteinase [Trichinella murrelli]